jgi:hypothetical protein
MVACSCAFGRTMRRIAAPAFLLSVLLQAQTAAADDAVRTGKLSLVNKGLVAVGRIPADLRDKFGETFGSGSGMVGDVTSWSRAADGYHGVLYLLPDRGYNITGTFDYRARLNKISIVLKPVAAEAAMPAPERQQSLAATLTDSMLLVDRAGQVLTGLDPATGGVRPATGGLPDLPQAPTGAISLDSEAVVKMPDGSFFISDEYGPYIYRFSADGRMLSAIRPPEAFIPKRNGRDHFSSNNPGPGAEAPEPADPERGRQNNQGFEGLSLTPGGKFLVAALQSATRQDGGDAPETRRYTRVLYYDIADLDHPKLVREHVLPLPEFVDAKGKKKVAAQSELLAIDETHFLLLCRDSGNGYGTDGPKSLYRKIEILDTTAASNIAGSPYDDKVAVAPKGKLADSVEPAKLMPFIDINDDSQLKKFGLHNGDPDDRNNLSEKWEGMALLPALDPENPHDLFLFVSNDNDFITRNGYQAGASYSDRSGAEVDTMILVYRVSVSD